MQRMCNGGIEIVETIDRFLGGESGSQWAYTVSVMAESRWPSCRLTEVIGAPACRRSDANECRI